MLGISKFSVIFLLALFAFLPAQSFASALEELYEKCEEMDEGEPEDEVLECYKKVIQLDPKHLEANLNLGRLYVELEQTENAKKLFSLAMEIDPKNVDAYVSRANVFYGELKLNEAMSDFAKAYQLDPSNVDVLFRIAEIHQDRSEHVDAIRRYTEYLVLKPSDREALSNRGLTYYSSNDLDKALIDLNAAVQQSPDFWPARLNRALVLEDKKDLPAALKDISHVLQSKKLTMQAEIKALEQRARIQLSLGEHKKALEDVNRGLAKEQTNSLLLKIKLEILESVNPAEAAAVQEDLNKLKEGAGYDLQRWEEKNVTVDEIEGK